MGERAEVEVRRVVLVGRRKVFRCFCILCGSLWDVDGMAEWGAGRLGLGMFFLVHYTFLVRSFMFLRTWASYILGALLAVVRITSIIHLAA